MIIDEGNETLRKELHKLKYELESLKSEREVTNIRHEEDLRAAQARAEGDYKRAQVRLVRYSAVARSITDARRPPNLQTISHYPNMRL